MHITIINDTETRLFCKIYAGPEAHLQGQHTFFIVLFKQIPFRDGAELKVLEIKPKEDSSWQTPFLDIRIYITDVKEFAIIGAVNEKNDDHKIIIVKDIDDPDLENIKLTQKKQSLLN